MILIVLCQLVGQVEEIAHLVKIDLLHRYPNFVYVGLAHNLRDGPWYDATVLRGSKLGRVCTHRIGLTASSLPIRKYAHVVPV